MAETSTTDATAPITAVGAAADGRVSSSDGTEIAYTRVGNGVPLILVDGALCDRAMGPNTKLASHLSSRFTVFTYDRRGRGESGDRAPYGVDREIEDLEAVIEAAGGSAYVYGISSGGALALTAATRLPSIKRLALYELPFVVDDSRPPIPSGWAAHLAEMAAAGRRADAVRYFLRDCVGVPRPVVALMRFMPAWPKLKALAHTLPYDARIVGDLGRGAPLPADRWAGATVPTLVVSGGKSAEWMQNAMRALGEVLPTAQYRTLPGQTHMVKPARLAPMLMEFFGS
jgi:pimeloyl-ACP methyl ester carboxylesterase